MSEVDWGGGAIEIDLDQPKQLKGDTEIPIYQFPDGEIIVDFEGDNESKTPGEGGFYGNLAEEIDDHELYKIADDLIDKIKYDIESREDWELRLADGLRILGIVREPEDDAPFPGASSVTYPLLAEAITQFNARAISELFPPAGPVKGTVVGKKTEEKEAQALRVQEHMNYQMTEEDEGYFDETDSMLIYLPLNGSAFKKTYWDDDDQIVTTKFVKAEDLIVPYAATNLRTAPRITHRYYMSQDDVRSRQVNGQWLEVDLDEPADFEGDENYRDLDQTIDEAEGRVATMHEDDRRHTIFEAHAKLALPGFPRYDRDGFPTDLQSPYIITIEKDSRKVLRIERNWREDDKKQRKRAYFSHYKFLPGLGFYGYGYLHMIGSLSEAATGALRALLDSASFANQQGGFKSADVRAEGGDVVLEPGVYHDTDMSAEDLSKAFYTPPFREPSSAMFQLLGFLVDAGRNFASINEALTGEGPATGPVGTMVALIEQGMKVFSGIHKRLHQAARVEFKQRAIMNRDYLTSGEYPYDVEDEERTIAQEDYDDRVDVVPVSDPNIFSATQRIAMAQGTLELANSAPHLYDMIEAHRRMLESMRVPDVDSILLDPNEKIERHDPVTENMLMLTGGGVRVFADQNHAAHVQVHMAFMQHPEFGGEQTAAQILQGPMMAHLAEHMVYMYQQRMLETGYPYRPVNLQPTGDDMQAQPIDPMADQEMSMIAASAAQQFLQSTGIFNGNPPQAPDKQAMEEEAFKAEEVRKQQSWETDEARKQQEWEREQQRDEAEFEREIAQKARAAKVEGARQENAERTTLATEAARTLERQENEKKQAASGTAQNKSKSASSKSKT